MTTNFLKICVPFSFKGVTFRPGCTIDLDREMSRNGSVPCLYTRVAEEGGIDTYSYEYEVMVMGTLEFEGSGGLATDFIRDGQFDSEGFEREWRRRRLDEAFQEIASRRLSKDLADVSGLKEALQEAYELGRNAPKASV